MKIGEKMMSAGNDSEPLEYFSDVKCSVSAFMFLYISEIVSLDVDCM